MQIHRVELATAYPAAQARFWGETLGLPVEGAEVRLARSTVAFVPAPPGEAPRYHFAFNIPRGRIDDAVAWLRDRVPVLRFPDGKEVIRFERSRADAVYFLDAAGNVVELMARETLPYDDERPFGAEHLLEVTEVGIASDDVPATVAALCAALGADIHWGGGDGLTAVGDAVGAVLVSPAGRGWIPTGLPAVPAPTLVVADGPRPGRTEIPGGPYVVETVG